MWWAAQITYIETDLIFHEDQIRGSQSCTKWVRSDSNSFVLCQVMIKKRSGESVLLILTCFPPDGAPSLVLRLFFLSSNACPYQTLCICLFPPCIPGHIALRVSLWPTLLSQLWPVPVLHRVFEVCLVLQSLLHYETVILQLSPITLHQYSPMLCYHHSHSPLWHCLRQADQEMGAIAHTGMTVIGHDVSIKRGIMTPDGMCWLFGNHGLVSPD